jgi:ribosomal protein S18 acetylase RimI-like enzyme
MLDKSLPYFDVIMRLPGGAGARALPALPDGFIYRRYAPGDGAAWCQTETDVREFDDAAQAGDYFRREFAPYPKELAARMVFVVTPDGVPVANAAAWWRQDAALGRVASLHWVAVRPPWQGLGLGRAVTCMALSLFAQNGQADEDVWLTTQTWSHRAIDLYLSLGFRAQKRATIAAHKNGFDGAARTLQGVMRPKSFAKFMYTAE